MKILSIDDMLEAAADCELPSYKRHVREVERVATSLAVELAHHLKIRAKPAEWLGNEFAGTCATFFPVKTGEECPKVIDEADPGGDWELMPQDRKGKEG